MHPRFQAAFARLAENLQSALAPILADEHFPALLTAEQITTLKQATDLDEDALAFALLPLAAACARADLSHFNVGAIARGVSGTRYFGGNMSSGRNHAADCSCGTERHQSRGCAAKRP